MHIAVDFFQVKTVVDIAFDVISATLPIHSQSTAKRIRRIGKFIRTLASYSKTSLEKCQRYLLSQLDRGLAVMLQLLLPLLEAQYAAAEIQRGWWARKNHAGHGAETADQLSPTDKDDDDKNSDLLEGDSDSFVY